MNYWLDLFTPNTWDRFRQKGSNISGFRERQRKTAFERVKEGDLFLCYLTKLSRWCGTLKVSSRAFEDSSPIFADQNDPFTVRFRVEPIVSLDFEYSVPMKLPDLWNRLSFTKNLELGAFGWGQSAGLRQSLVQLDSGDATLIIEMLNSQVRSPQLYPLDVADRRHVEQRTVVRTAQGEVEVEVPDREELHPVVGEAAREARESHVRQAKVVELGAALGFSIWLPAGDRVRVFELLTDMAKKAVLSVLPVNFDPVTTRTIENIDVIWLQRRAIMHAFEVEHTTSIYSGLLRMADLLAMQPRINISLHIVAPMSRREEARREIVRPVFSVLDGGPMAERCSFLSYDAIDKILAQPNLAHLRETILDDFEEFFVE